MRKTDSVQDRKDACQALADMIVFDGRHNAGLTQDQAIRMSRRVLRWWLSGQRALRDDQAMSAEDREIYLVACDTPTEEEFTATSRPAV